MQNHEIFRILRRKSPVCTELSYHIFNSTNLFQICPILKDRIYALPYRLILQCEYTAIPKNTGI